MRYKIVISYDGKKYSGFQIQNNALSIQEVLEKTLSQVFGEVIKVNGSGRTDAMVSAIGQVCDFESDIEMKGSRVIGYANALMQDIKILECDVVSDDFHSRFSAKTKTYTYFFYQSRIESPVYDRFAYHVSHTLDIDAMKRAVKYLIGEHDFTSFCAINTEVQNKVRYIYSASIYNIYDKVYAFEITGNGFLYNMVRIIVGTLLDIGCGKKLPEYILELYDLKDRNKAGKTVPSEFLLLKTVAYKDDIID